MMRQMVGLNALTQAQPKELAALLAPLFTLLVEGEGAPVGRVTKQRTKQRTKK